MGCLAIKISTSLGCVFKPFLCAFTLVLRDLPWYKIYIHKCVSRSIPVNEKFTQKQQINKEKNKKTCSETRLGETERYRTGWNATCCQWGRRIVTDSGLARHVACSVQATTNGPETEIGHEIGLWLSHPPCNHRSSCKGISMRERVPNERGSRESQTRRATRKKNGMQREQHAEREQYADVITCREGSTQRENTQRERATHRQNNTHVCVCI